MAAGPRGPKPSPSESPSLFENRSLPYTPTDGPCKPRPGWGESEREGTCSGGNHRVNPIASTVEIPTPCKTDTV